MAKSYDVQIAEAQSLDDINSVIQKIEKSPTLADEKKESLLIEAQTRKNAIENEIRDSGSKIPDDPIHSPENKKPPAPVVHGEPPTIKVEVTVDELHEKEKVEWKGKLYGWTPFFNEKGKPTGKGIAQVLACLLICLLAVPSAFAVREAALGRDDSSGRPRWEVDAGDILPGTTKTYDVGSATYQVDSVFTEDITIEDFYKLTPVLIANLPATGLSASTDAGAVYLVYDADDVTDCTSGGGTTRNFCVAGTTGWVDF